jgi:hypothetical protein
MKKQLVVLAALSGTLAAAHAGVLTTDGVTFTSGWSGNVLTLEIDATGRSNGWAGATGLAALAIKGVGTYGSARVGSAPGGTGAWTMSTAELNASGCAGTGNGAAGTRMCFYGPQIKLTDDMVFKFTFTGADVTPTEPHVKVEFVDARGNKVGSLLSQTLPASPPAAATNTTAPVTPTMPLVPPTSTATRNNTAADTAGTPPVPTPAATKTPSTTGGTFDVAMNDDGTAPSGTPAPLPPRNKTCRPRWPSRPRTSCSSRTPPPVPRRPPSRSRTASPCSSAVSA